MEQIAEQMNNALRLLGDIEEHVARGSSSSTGGLRTYRALDAQKTVCIRVTVITVSNIDTVNNQFDSEFVLNVKWQLPDLIEGQAEDNRIKSWDPLITFINATMINKFDIRSNLTQRPTGGGNGGHDYARMSIRVRGTFNFEASLNDFPFDYQKLVIKVQSTWTTDNLKFEKDSSARDSVRTDMLFGKPEWKLWECIEASSAKEHRNPASSPNSYPLHEITMYVSRRITYYKTMLTIAMMMVLITPLSLVSFSENIENNGTRSSITLAFLLATAASKLLPSMEATSPVFMGLPNLYSIWCIAFHCIILILHVFDGYSRKNASIGLGVVHIIFSLGAGLAAIVMYDRSARKRKRKEEKYSRDVGEQGNSDDNNPPQEDKQMIPSPPRA